MIYDINVLGELVVEKSADLILEEVESKELELSPISPQVQYERDYEKLKNLPELDGRKIIGNIPEQDPTVPMWAKSESKPIYTAEEVNAVNRDDEITLEELNEIFEGIFK